MLTLICCIAFFGFYVLYHTSKRADLTQKYFLQEWIHQHSTISKPLGLFFLVLGLVLSVLYMGYGTGIFSYIVTLMTLLSFIVLISPLRLFKMYLLYLPFLFLVIELYLV
ncbi:hypothetical protein [Wenyingzhuangia sp. IMCC45467]